MATWTRVLKPKAVVNGRLVMVQTKNACYYQYFIFPTEIQTYANESEIIKSGFNYTSWKAAFSEGQKAAKQLTNENK